MYLYLGYVYNISFASCHRHLLCTYYTVFIHRTQLMNNSWINFLDVFLVCKFSVW